jgi:hypothetical protein
MSEAQLLAYVANEYDRQDENSFKHDCRFKTISAIQAAMADGQSVDGILAAAQSVLSPRTSIGELKRCGHTISVKDDCHFSMLEEHEYDRLLALASL